MQPAWTLTGGAALAGFHAKHRTTRDLDLFWRESNEVGDLARDVAQRLGADGLQVEWLRTTAMFVRLDVREGEESCLVDLVADPVGALEPPRHELVLGAVIQVDSPHEILVNKLCALLSRSELRDLFDLKVLLEAGGDLERALADAPRKDTGFSPLTLAWVLKSLPVGKLARGLEWEEALVGELEGFQRAIAERLATASAPPPSDRPE